MRKISAVFLRQWKMFLSVEQSWRKKRISSYLSALFWTCSNLVKSCRCQTEPGHSVQFQHRCTHIHMHPHAFTQPHSAHTHGNRLNVHGVFLLLFFLHPGVGGAGELVRPVWRPPRGGVEVHVVGVGFESERLAGVAVGGGRGEVDRLVLVALLSVALWGRQVHSVAVVVLPVGLVVKWLCVLGEEQWCHD